MESNAKPVIQNDKITHDILNIYYGEQIFIIIPYQQEFIYLQALKDYLEDSVCGKNPKFPNKLSKKETLCYVMFNYNEYSQFKLIDLQKQLQSIRKQQDIIPVEIKLQGKLFDREIGVTLREIINLQFIKAILADITKKYPNFLKKEIDQMSESFKLLNECLERVGSLNSPFSTHNILSIYSDIPIG